LVRLSFEIGLSVEVDAVSPGPHLTKGRGSRAARLALIYKLMEAAEGRWRKLTGSRPVALVRAGARFVDGSSSKEMS
jgi:hypothetical protein